MSLLQVDDPIEQSSATLKEQPISDHTSSNSTMSSRTANSCVQGRVEDMAASGLPPPTPFMNDAFDPFDRDFAAKRRKDGDVHCDCRTPAHADPGSSQQSMSHTRLRFRDRVRHFTWTWFTMTMATGGIANVLAHVPYQFPGLYALGCVFFILNIVLFAFNVAMISARFYLYPSTFKASFLHPTESLFIPASIISVGTILLNISEFGVGDKTGPWLTDTMIVLYWVYCAAAILGSSGIYLIMWSTQTFTISQMTPVWIFPAYPLLIVGPHASNLASKTSPSAALEIIIGGVVLQGIGFMVSLMIYSAFLYRLMTQKLPKESLRPGMFISVGPSGFTISGIVGMGQLVPQVVGADFMGDGVLAGQVTKIVANWAGLWLWGLAFWFFLVSVFAHWSPATRGTMRFAMPWYSFIFPNTALTTATFAIARAFGPHHHISTSQRTDLASASSQPGLPALNILGCVMTGLLVVAWTAVFAAMLRAVYLRQILWPQRQEDRDEGGWVKKDDDGEDGDEGDEEVVVEGEGGEGAKEGVRKVRTRRPSMLGRARERVLRGAEGGAGGNGNGRGIGDANGVQKRRGVEEVV
ncbi:hypothetical protein EJ05DRAFT_508162 [Pseudovirgaria hyperparasitica]|uniref:C4-dicarboxylate/malic acid transporter n=1 Tax=Pseudovirgaria hyperparasitica TaxID=470096 RepID=A0A6A6WDZ6_9PEZI|nr:uncharacterized protein EJ05DRAFT_508162 [Pseudovirgaria hyperparasitica]KAF2760933.1 hypothetical protein EJ05DRAFT_508162 [Pseudovirgaria hyperparasitica]